MLHRRFLGVDRAVRANPTGTHAGQHPPRSAQPLPEGMAPGTGHALQKHACKRTVALLVTRCLCALNGTVRAYLADVHTFKYLLLPGVRENPSCCQLSLAGCSLESVFARAFIDCKTFTIQEALKPPVRASAVLYRTGICPLAVQVTSPEERERLLSALSWAASSQSQQLLLAMLLTDEVKLQASLRAFA
eukprot:1158564-Pelagomonas_calceolata.AAC.2